MSLPKQVLDFLAAQKAFNERDEAATSAIVTSIEGVTSDVAGFNAKIKELQDKLDAGTVLTAEDIAALEEATTRGNAAARKLEAATKALQALDESTAPTVPPPTI